MMSPYYTFWKMWLRGVYNTGRVLKEAGLNLDRVGSRMVNDIAYMQELSRHKSKMALYESVPSVDQCWIAPNATLVGDVIVSKWAAIWYNATLKGEYNSIRVGHFSSIGDGTSINTACSLPHGLTASVNIGKNVIIGPGCSLYSCIIDDDCVIGANCVIMQGARLERGCEILPNSVVPPGRLIPAG